MATVNKDFRIKHGLVVEGSTATIDGYNVVTEGPNGIEFIEDKAAGLFTNGSHTGISFSYNDAGNAINATVSANPAFQESITFEGITADSYETVLQVTDPTQDNIITLPDATGIVALTSDITSAINALSTSDIEEGTNLYYTEERVQDEINDTLVAGEGIDLSYNDTAGTLTIDAELASDTNKGVASFSSTDFTVTSGAVSLNSEAVQDIVGGMVTGNTETGITVTYEDSDGTLDFAVADQFPSHTTTDLAEGTNLYFTDERAQDAIGSAINAGTQTGITVTYSDASNKIDFSVANQFTGKTTSDLAEGTNLYYTDERVDDRVNDLLVDGTGISTVYNDGSGTLTINNTGVVALSGTANEVEVTNVGTSYTVGLPNDITIAGNITINGTPTNANHVATVGYVDAATAGLNVHDSVKAATTTNINLSTDLEAGDTLDGGPGGSGAVTLVAGNRVLVKDQTNKAQNGVYIVQASGAAVRATDYDSAGEVDAGDFIFVEGGYANGKTGWVQTNTITTIGTDNIEFTQFSGAGTYTAGNGLTLQNGSQFVIDTTITADLTTAQTLTNKTLTSPTISGLYLSDNNIIVEGTNDVHETTLTFTDPTQDNTITFKDATGIVAFTSDIPSSTTGLSEGTNLYFTDERAQDALATAFAAGTHTNITITYDDANNKFSFAAQPGYTDEQARDAIGAALTAGSGIGISVNDGADTITVSNTGILSVTGTTDQVSASTTSGAVTLSLPQNIATTSSPTFAGLTVGSLTLTDALLGTAVASLTDTSATVIDTWAASAYSSAKYVVQMKKGNDIEVIEVLVTVDGNNNVYLTEYADVISNTQIGTTDADYSSGNVRLLVTASNGTTVKVHKTLVEA